ncbi:unnamed protein product [Pleuronectes platessa]|uniref:Uncharacterized protein n=1 Tax=Pleuronectes platessa TaxID=8262 RepID=A0A9N7VIJ5_PLEPL|nr:unnamed protein product [Pleuronectes platessa]
MVEEVVEEMGEGGDGRKAVDLAAERKENGWTQAFINRSDGELKVTRRGCLAPGQHVSITSVTEGPAEDGRGVPGRVPPPPRSRPSPPLIPHALPPTSTFCVG